MKIYINKIFLLISLVLFFLGNSVYAVTDEELNKIASETVNNIRNGLYLNESKTESGILLIDRFPWVKDALAVRKSQITPSENLQKKAVSINYENSHFVHDYDSASKKGFFTGQIAFNNFIPFSRVLEIVLTQELSRELSLEYSGKRFLLDPGFDQVGVSVKPVKFKKGGMMNGYKIVIVFASSEKQYQAVSLNILNTLRNAPTSSWSYISDSYPSEIIGFNYWFYLSQKIPTPPVFYINDFLNFSLVEQEIIVLPSYGELSFHKKIEKSMSALILKELREESANTVLYSPKSRGVCFFSEYFSSPDVNSSIDNFSIKSSILGKGYENSTSDLVGFYLIVYKDHNQNGLYNSGEELINKNLKLIDEFGGLELSLQTDNAGRINSYIYKNRDYLIELKNETTGENIYFTFSTKTDNVFMAIEQ